MKTLLTITTIVLSLLTPAASQTPRYEGPPSMDRLLPPITQRQLPSVA